MVAKQTTLIPIPVRGRKVKRREEIDAPRAARRDPCLRARSKRRKTAQSSSAGLSYLELLPAELIEQIFLECLEFSLPRASPRLGASLSREPLYRALILYALWNDPIFDSQQVNEGAALEAVRRMFRPLHYTPISLNDRYTLQLAIWDCRWCTFDRIRGYLRDFTNLSLHRWLYGHGKHVDGLQIDAGDLDAIVAGLESHTLNWIPRALAGKVSSISCQIGPVEFPLRMKHPRHWNDRFSSADDPIPVSREDFHPVRVVALPGKLLAGGSWTDDKVAFLAFLRGCIKVAYSSEAQEIMAPGKPYQGEQLQKGIRSAIIEQNPRALRQLLELGSEFSIAYPDLFGDDEHTLPSYHYLTAIDQSEDPTMVKLLIRGAARAIPRDNARFTAWAMRLEERGDPFGRWILDLMGDTHYCDLFDSEGFPHGESDSHEYFSVFGHYPYSWLKEMQPVSDEREWILSE